VSNGNVGARVLHIGLTASPRMADMRLPDSLVFVFIGTLYYAEVQL